MQGSPCRREKNWFWGALLSEQFQSLEFQLRGNGVGHAVQGAARGGCAFQRLVLCLEAGMEASLPLQRSPWVVQVCERACGSGAGAKQRALGHNRTSLA